jgi:hypothetical protein
MKAENLELHVTVLGWVNLIGGGLFLAGGLFCFVFFAGIGAASGDPKALGILGVIGTAAAFFLTVVALPGLAAGYGLLKRRTWARVLGMAVSILHLINVPIGTLIGIYGLWVLTDDGAREFFKGASVATGTA